MAGNERFHSPQTEPGEAVWTKVLLEATVDPADDAVHIRVSAKKVAETKSFDDLVNIDVDANGDVVAIEILGANFRRAIDNRENSQIPSEPVQLT